MPYVPPGSHRRRSVLQLHQMCSEHWFQPLPTPKATHQSVAQFKHFDRRTPKNLHARAPAVTACPSTIGCARTGPSITRGCPSTTGAASSDICPLEAPSKRLLPSSLTELPRLSTPHGFPDVLLLGDRGGSMIRQELYLPPSDLLHRRGSLKADPIDRQGSHIVK